MEFSNLTLNEVKKFLEHRRLIGPKIISALGRLTPQINSMVNSEPGREILNQEINRMEDLFIKIYREEATDIERSEFRYLRDIRLPMIIEKLDIYLKGIEEIKKYGKAD